MLLNKRNNRGFTLIELVGTITIIALLAVIVLPPIMNQITGTKGKLSATTLQLIYSATELYLSENVENYPKNNGNVFCVELSQLISEEKLAAPLKDFESGEDISTSRYVRVTVTTSKDLYELMGINDCTQNVDVEPNKPLLTSNMIPVVWNADGKVLKADTNTKWYDYKAKVWANAVVIKSNKLAYYKQLPAGSEVYDSDILMYYVWIPRFKYSIPYSATNVAREIAIKFEVGKQTTGTSTTASSAYPNVWEVAESEYMTHPAFTYNSTQLTGFWIGKFETGYDQRVTTPTKVGAEVNTPNLDRILIKPNIPSWRNVTLNNVHTVVTSMKNVGNIYGFVDNTTSMHILKNNEWGAVSYLSYSRYGTTSLIRNNNNTNYLTGCAAANQDDPVSSNCDAVYNNTVGKAASTNRDFSGVYDLVGGAKEYVMGNYANGTGTLFPVNSGFVVPYPSSYYYNSFSTTNFTTACSGVCYGQALSETSAWNNDKIGTLSATNPWLTRGGNNNETTSTGLFNYDIADGANNTGISFRIVITNE